MKRIAAERDRLLASGRKDAAWTLVARCVRELPVGAAAEAFLYHSVVLAVHYSGIDAAEGWISTYAGRARASGTAGARLEEALKALRLVLEIGRKDHATADALEASIRWDELEAVPWAVNLRLLRELNRGDLASAVRIAQESPARFREPLEIGRRLQILGGFHVDLGDASRCLSLNRAAFAHLRRDRSLRARLGRIELDCQLGRLHFNQGAFEAAAARLERALRAARAVHHEPFVRDYSVELALCHANLGRYAAAREALEPVSAPPGGGDRVEVFRQVRIWQARAEIALEDGDADGAVEGLQRAEAILDRHPHARHRAYLDAARARLVASEGTEAARERALHYLDRAEAAFAKLGARGVHGLSRSLVSRGHIHLARREVERALECSIRSMELARHAGFLPLQARSLLLKSYVLLEADLPVAERAYEEVLRDLGLVHSPVILFRVLANLYMYSWKLHDRLDLTAHHLEQLHRLRGSLDPGIFGELYARHVTQRVLGRFLGGVRPGAVVE